MGNNIQIVKKNTNMENYRNTGKNREKQYTVEKINIVERIQTLGKIYSAKNYSDSGKKLDS